MQTVEDPAEVPASARAAVKVTDPHHPLPGDTILEADLRVGSKPFPVRLVRNGAWLDRMMPKTSLLTAAPGVATEQPVARTEAASPAPAQASRGAANRRRPGPPGKTKGRTGDTPERGQLQLKAPAPTGLPSVAELAQAANRPQIILYSTAWCPSCRTARQYFQQRGLPFRELDVEQDPAALQQYQALQTSFRLRPGVVPLIVINGKPFQGFSKGQIEAALAGS